MTSFSTRAPQLPYVVPGGGKNAWNLRAGGKNAWNPRGFTAGNPRKVRGVHELRGIHASLMYYHY